MQTPAKAEFRCWSQHWTCCGQSTRRTAQMVVVCRIHSPSTTRSPLLRSSPQSADSSNQLMFNYSPTKQHLAKWSPTKRELSMWTAGASIVCHVVQTERCATASDCTLTWLYIILLVLLHWLTLLERDCFCWIDLTTLLEWVHDIDFYCAELWIHSYCSHTSLMRVFTEWMAFTSLSQIQKMRKMGKKTMRKVGGTACFMKSFGRRGMLQMYMGKWAEKVNFTYLITVYWPC